MTSDTPQSRTASARHATLLVLVMMAVSASPGVFRDGLAGGPKQLIENRQVLPTARDGGEEHRVTRRDHQDDETRPAPCHAQALVGAGPWPRLSPVCGLPFAVTAHACVTDARPCARWQVVISCTSRPPPVA